MLAGDLDAQRHVPVVVDRWAAGQGELADHLHPAVQRWSRVPPAVG
jgi:hypothetical protein